MNPLTAVSFYETFANLEAVFKNATDAAMNSALGELRGLLPMLLVPLIIACGVLISTGQLGMGKAVSVGGRICVVLLLISGGGYALYVHDFFIDALSTQFATTINGGGTTLTVTQQFAKVDAAAVNFATDALKQATGIFQTGDRVAIYFALLLQKILIGVVFIIFTVARITLFLAVAIGVWLVPMLLFEHTRGWPLQMLGKMVSLSLFILGQSIILKIVLAVMFEAIAASKKAGSASGVDTLIASMFNIALLDLGVVVLVFVLPAIVSIGCGSVAGAAMGGAFMGGRTISGAMTSMTRAANSMSRAAGAMRRR